jgi:hypothetical protein
MKNTALMLLLAFFVVSAAKAQIPTQSDSGRIDHPPRRPDPTPATGSQPQLNQDVSQSTDPLIRVKIDAIPAAMRKILENNEYRGWQKSGVYQDGRSSEYVVDIRRGDSIQTFRFDRSGMPVKSSTSDNRP